MSLESAREFMDKYRNDTELAAKLTTAASPAEKMAIAKAEGFSFSLEELTKANEELSEAELDTVVGGEWSPWCDGEGHCGATCEADCIIDNR